MASPSDLTGIRLDLHTHTWRSGDSTTTFDDYVSGFQLSGLAAIAVTDHLTIVEAERIKRHLGSPIIVGQEFRTREGECIGLFLSEPLPPTLTFAEAAARIRLQGGLTYVPHPGDTSRRSITFTELERLCCEGLVDVIESGNSKIRDLTLLTTAHEIAVRHRIPEAASSDAHVPAAIGSSYTTIGRLPTSGQELKDLLFHGSRHYRHCDPPRPWTDRIVPSHDSRSSS